MVRFELAVVAVMALIAGVLWSGVSSEAGLAWIWGCAFGAVTMQVTCRRSRD